MEKYNSSKRSKFGSVLGSKNNVHSDKKTLFESNVLRDSSKDMTLGVAVLSNTVACHDTDQYYFLKVLLKRGKNSIFEN